ncbi:hypothetical protein BIW11_14145, partial [Tropilaelaps mercedesae]
WCESQKECGRLRFTDLLVKPMQRLTKYSLLLKAILKKTDQPDARAGLAEMNDIVERFVCNVDAKLRQRHELERLESIIGRIEAYEPFDTTSDEVEKALRDNLALDLTCAMPGCGPQQSRQLVAEVPGVKMRDAASSGKIDVHCLLLTDMLLLCKSVGRKGQDKLKVIRQPFVVERLVVRDLKDASLLLVYQNEYRVVAWYLQLFGQEPVLRGLVEQLRKAQEHSSHSSLVHSHSGSIDMSDPVSTSSQAPTVPCPTPLFGASSGSSPQGGRATSFELGELQRQDSSCQLDHLDLLQQHRSRSVETRTSSVFVTVTSPRPERRAFLLKGCSPVGPPGTAGAGSGSNTLTVSVPFQQQQPSDKQEGPGTQTSQTIQVPLVSPTKTLSPHSPPSPRTLQRALLHNSSPTKPPLLKTKNVSGLVTHSAPASEGPSPVHSLDSSTDSTSMPLNVQPPPPSSGASPGAARDAGPGVGLQIGQPSTHGNAATPGNISSTAVEVRSDVSYSIWKLRLISEAGVAPSRIGRLDEVRQYFNVYVVWQRTVDRLDDYSNGHNVNTMMVTIPNEGWWHAKSVITDREGDYGGRLRRGARSATPRIGMIPVGVIPAVSPVEPPTPVQETPNPILPLSLAIHTSPPAGQGGSSGTPTAGANFDSPAGQPAPADGRQKEEPTPPPRPHRDLPPPPPRRTPRTDGSGRLHPRRHHTADSFEHLKQSRDASIHKRLSWNCGQQLSDTAAGCPSSARSVSSAHGHGVASHQQTMMAADLRSRNQCLSSESVYSSSGVSSTGSLLLSGEDGAGGLMGAPLSNTGAPTGPDAHMGQHPFPQQTIVINGIDPFEDDPIQEEDEGSAAEETPQPVPIVRAKPHQLDYIARQPGSRIKIDISEVKI